MMRKMLTGTRIAAVLAVMFLLGSLSLGSVFVQTSDTSTPAQATLQAGVDEPDGDNNQAGVDEPDGDNNQAGVDEIDGDNNQAGLDEIDGQNGQHVGQD